MWWVFFFFFLDEKTNKQKCISLIVDLVPGTKGCIFIQMPFTSDSGRLVLLINRRCWQIWSKPTFSKLSFYSKKRNDQFEFQSLKSCTIDLVMYWLSWGSSDETFILQVTSMTCEMTRMHLKFLLILPPLLFRSTSFIQHNRNAG